MEASPPLPEPDAAPPAPRPRRRRLRWVVVVPLTLAALAVSVPLAQQVERLYFLKTATSTLHIARRPRHILFDPGPPRAEDEFAEYKRTQVAYIKDRRVLGNALSKEEVARLETVKEHADDLEQWLAEHLRVEFPGEGEIMSISLSGHRPKDLATIVNAVVDSYMGLVVGEEKRAQNERLGKLTKLLSGYQERLELQRKALKELDGEAGGSVAVAFAGREAERASVREALAEVRREQRRLNLEKAGASARLNELKADAARAAALATEVAVLQAQIKALGSEREALLAQQAELREAVSVDQSHVDLESRRESLQIAAEVSRKVGAEVERVQIEMDAPDRISLLSKASPPR